MSDSIQITSAGQLLSEMRAMQQGFADHRTLGDAIPVYFSFGGKIPWQVGVLRYDQLVDRVIRDLDILPPERQDKYRSTLENNVRGILRLKGLHGETKAAFKAHFDDLTRERIENFHDSLSIGGRSFSLEKARIEAATQAIADLISEIGIDPSDIDDFIISKLTELLVVLEKYELFGQEGVRDYVNSLMGSVLMGVLEIKGPVPDQVKSRVLKVMGVAKATMDGFVYLATGAQTIEWANSHLLALTGPVT